MGRVQHCASCHNHGQKSPKRGHVCRFEKCKCILCKLLKLAQMAMRHQQRVWRHQKEKLKLEDLTNLLEVDGETKPQVCDKCRNHNELVRKRNHKCKYFDCNCDYCTLTFKRREIMKHLQRVRRSGVTSDTEAEEFFERNKSQFGEAEEENNCNISEEDGEIEDLQRVDSHHSSPESSEEQQTPQAPFDDIVKSEKYDVLECQGEDIESTENGLPSISNDVMESTGIRDTNEQRTASYSTREHFDIHSSAGRHSPSLKRPYPSDCDSPPPLIPVGNVRMAATAGSYQKRRSVSPVNSFDRTEKREFQNRERVPSSFDMRFSLDGAFQLPNQSAMTSQFPYNTSMSIEQLRALNASLVQSMCPMDYRKHSEEIQLSTTDWMQPHSFFSRSVEALHQAGQSAAFFQQLQQQNELRNQKQPIRPQPLNLRPPCPPHMVLPRHLLSQMMFPPYTINFSSSEPHYQTNPTSLESLSNLVDSSRLAQVDRFHM